VTRYLLISRSAEYESRLRRLLGRQLDVIEGENLAFGPTAVLDKVTHPPAVAVLGPILNFEETKSLIGGLVDRYPAIGIVVVRENRSELEDWVDEMPIHAVLTPAADDETITEVMARLESRDAGSRTVLEEVPDEIPHEAEAHPPAVVNPEPPPLDNVSARVIAVIAPKGGQGKTTLAINLAAGLAEVAPNSVVLVDADVQFGDVANGLEIPLDRTLIDLVGGHVDELVLKTSLSRHRDGFFVIPAPANPEDGERVSAAGLGELLSRLSEIFRYIVVDTTPGLGEHSLAVIESATDAIVVTNMGVPSLRAVHSELGILRTLGLLPDRRVLVLNFVDRASGLTLKDVATIVGVAPDIVVPRSSAVLLSSNRGEPVIHREPRDSASRAIRELVARIDPTIVMRRKGVHRRDSAS
jgi:MinD-like ATPase involved in chromosome partitioning or flagellar assembly